MVSRQTSPEEHEYQAKGLVKLYRRRRGMAERDFRPACLRHTRRSVWRFLTLAVILMEGRPPSLRSLLKAALFFMRWQTAVDQFFSAAGGDGILPRHPAAVCHQHHQLFFMVHSLPGIPVLQVHSKSAWRCRWPGCFPPSSECCMDDELEIVIQLYAILVVTAPFIALWLVSVTLARRRMPKRPPRTQPVWPAGVIPREPRAL